MKQNANIELDFIFSICILMHCFIRPEILFAMVRFDQTLVNLFIKFCLVPIHALLHLI